MAVLVLVEVNVKPESMNDMQTHFKETLPDTRAFDGCQGLALHSNSDDPNNLVVVSNWDSRDHHGRYLAWRTERGDFDQLGSILVGEPSIRYFDIVDV